MTSHKKNLKKVNDNLLKHYPIFLLSLFLFFACGGSEEKTKKESEPAEEHPETSEENALKTEEFSLDFLDSLLIVNTRQADNLKKTLLFTKNAEYQTFGFYYDKNQSPERIAGKSLLKFDVDETGVMSVAAIGYGIGKKKFNSLKVETENNIYAETPALPEDGGNNYVSELNGVHTRILNYTHGKDGGFIDFIYIYKDRPLKISYIGADVVCYSFTLTKNEKEALTKVYELSNALLNIKDINDKINKKD